MTRKRQRNELEWIDSLAKKARATGIEGVGRTKIIKAKSMKSPCIDKCYMKCTSKITEEERKIAHDQFYGLADTTKQWQCIGNWVSMKEEKKLDEEATELAKIFDKPLNKKKYFNFTLPTVNGPTSVCRTMFVNTLSMLNF